MAPDFDRVIAIQINGPLEHDLIVGETIQLSASALNAAGEAVTDAVIMWSSLNEGQLAFSLDPATGAVVALEPGEGDVQAQVETLRSESITIRVTTPSPAPVVNVRINHGTSDSRNRTTQHAHRSIT